MKRVGLAICVLLFLVLACGEATFPDPGRVDTTVYCFRGLYESLGVRTTIEGTSDRPGCPEQIGVWHLVECY